MPYSRDEVIREVTSFYEFLLSLYLPPDALKLPPPGGWPEVTADYLQILKKDDAVVDLLKHLPYIRRDNDTPYEIYQGCVCNDYTGTFFQELASFGIADGIEPQEEKPTIESHVATLACAVPHDNGFFILCDTKEGTLELVDFIDGSGMKRDVNIFFETLKKEYRTLYAVPISPGEIELARRAGSQRIDGLQDIYRKHGWPSDSFNKDKCAEEIMRFDRANVRPYSRDEVVREVTSFYEFLVSLYLPPDALKYPPPEGWPGITHERIAFQGKDETVVDLLKHLPYIRRDRALEPYQIFENCSCNDYSGKHFENAAVKLQSRRVMELDEIEPHIGRLAQGEPADNGYFIYCDTKEGTIELLDWIVGKHRTYPIRKFFRVMKDEFRSLTVIPIEPSNVSEVKGMGDDDLVTKLRDVFHKHGWPDGQYKKDQCLIEARATWESHMFGE